MWDFVYMCLISMFPVFELRVAIPFGILKAGFDWRLVFLVCVVFNMFIGFILIFILDFFVNFMRRFDWFDKFYSGYVFRLQERYKKNIILFGKYALILFIAIPIPGSGVYSASIISKTLGLSKRNYFLACVFGVLLSGFVVTLLTLGVDFFI